MSNQPLTTSKRLSLSAILCAIALTIFTIEAQIPSLIPIPYVKLGLANTVTLFAILHLPKKDVFLILIGRILLGSIFIANPSILIYSLSGGIVSLVFEFILFKPLGKKHIVEISIIGAMIHNLVQIICAYFVTATTYVFLYLPPLMIVAAITGLFCGLSVFLVDKLLDSAIIKLIKNK